MLTKIVFISDRLQQFQTYLKANNAFGFGIDLLNHSEAGKRFIFRNFYELFIVDLQNQLLSIPQWIREQAQHHYFHQFIFISDKKINPLITELLGQRIFKTIDSKTAANDLQEVVQKARLYFEEHQYRFDPSQFVTETPFEGLLGEHTSVKRINDFIKLVSKARYAPCLISGEDGTGKELCANLIHRANELRDDLFFIKNCENQTTNDLLGDLFGVEDESGIYGPVHKGLLEAYSDGTVILKNIHKTPPDVQDKLLHYLEDKAFRPLGSKRVVEVNTRIIAFCERNLGWYVKHRNFNSDLFFHLNAFEISLPPLRERGEDIILLANYYLQAANQQLGKSISQISAPAKRTLKNYYWPGNIEELKNAIEEAVLHCKSKEIELHDLDDHLNGSNGSPVEDTQLGNCTLKEIERIHIEQVLANTEGNKSRAASILEISRTTLREKIRQYSL